MMGGRVFTQNFSQGDSVLVLYCPLARIANFLLVAKNIASQIRQSNLSLNEHLVSLFAEYFWVSGVSLRVVYLYKWESVEKRNRNVYYICATAGEEWHLRATKLLGADRWREQKGLAFVIFILIRPTSYHVCIDLSLTH